MNVVRFLVDTFRRPTSRFRAGSVVTPLLVTDPQREPYKYEIQRQAVRCLIPGAQCTTEEKIEAVAKIGHLCWTGGTPAAEFTTKNYLMYFANILAMNEQDSLKLQIMKSLCEICGTSSLTQDLARIHSLVEIVVKSMRDKDDEYVQWCLHTLFYMLCDNKANQEEALRYPAFEAGIVRGLSLSWDGWKYNEARELVLLCQLHQYM